MRSIPYAAERLRIMLKYNDSSQPCLARTQLGEDDGTSSSSVKERYLRQPCYVSREGPVLTFEGDSVGDVRRSCNLTRVNSNYDTTTAINYMPLPDIVIFAFTRLLHYY